jgi:hypothetical protein
MAKPLSVAGFVFVGLLLCRAAQAANGLGESVAHDCLQQPSDENPAACNCCGEFYEDCQDCDCPRLFGMLPSDHCFDRFISPLSNPFFFEDPRSLTEVRGVFLVNNLPPGLGTGEVEVTAGQLRGRLTDRLSVIAPRLAYLQANPRGDGSPKGFTSAPVGLKYNFLRDVDQQLVVSGGVTYFIPGEDAAYSGFGDGDVHVFLTGGKQILDCGHWLSGTGFRLLLDSNWGTQLWYWSNQWDYELPGHLYPLAGVNWYHWLKNAGNNYTDGITGLDLINLPTAGVAGATYIFCLPGSPSACKDAWDGILLHQLDYRYRPCNFVEIMPRLDEHLRRPKAKGATV